MLTPLTNPNDLYTSRTEILNHSNTLYRCLISLTLLAFEDLISVRRWSKKFNVRLKPIEKWSLKFLWLQLCAFHHVSIYLQKLICFIRSHILVFQSVCTKLPQLQSSRSKALQSGQWFTWGGKFASFFSKQNRKINKLSILSRSALSHLCLIKEMERKRFVSKPF